VTDTFQFESLSLRGLADIRPDLDLNQYFGLWAIEESSFRMHWESIRAMNLPSHVATGQARSAASVSEPDPDGLVRIDIRGTMTKQGSSLSGAGSTVRIRQAVRDAKNSADVAGVMLVLDTPGGTVAGTAELAEDIWELSQVKPTVSFVEDLMASAGLYVGSQSRKVFANVPNAIVGSMGVFIGLYDLSGMAAKEGIRPVLIRTGDLKGAGFAGTEITDDQKAMWQGLVDSSFESFKSAVMRTRKLSAAQVTELSRAGVYSAQVAIERGLVDGIRSYDAALAELRSMVPKRRKGAGMTDKVERQAATLADLKVAIVGANAEFYVSCLERGMTVAEAQSGWMTKLTAEVEDLRGKLAASDEAMKKLKADHATEVAGLKESLAKAEAKASTGWKPVEGGGKGGPDGSAKAEWDRELKALMATGMEKRVAVQHLVATNEELHKRYLAELNGRS